MPDVHASKFLSLILRHKPEAAGLTLDAEGWAEVDLILAATGLIADRAHLERIVATNDKKRFVLSGDGRLIRAAQGHSVSVDLGLKPVAPPEVLYHGTATRFLDPIRAEGLKPGSRQFVHLSKDEATAVKVGQRHGRPVVLRVAASDAHAAGQRFCLADNGVWLSDALAPRYLVFPEG
jgi:putative RNA 2'-phosphotransferase